MAVINIRINDEVKKEAETIFFLAKVFNLHKSTIEYLISLIKKHGYDILRNDKNRIYSKDFKLQTINRILIYKVLSIKKENILHTKVA